MKKYISKINQYLLENYPTIWNTKIVWMTLVSLFIHLIFFTLGYYALTNPEQLHSYGAKTIFFENGTVFFSVIISVLLLVVWLVHLFKNNSFKNFYPTSRVKLFAQFFSYLFIIFIGSTFYITYTFGVKAYIKNKYPDDLMAQRIQTANDASTFFSHKLHEYEIDERRYPAPFDNTYWESGDNVIYGKPYLKWLNQEYQLYSVTTKEFPFGFDSVPGGYTYYISKDSTNVYYYKDTVVDLLKYPHVIKSKNKIDTVKRKPKKVLFKGKYIKIAPNRNNANVDDLAVPSYYNYSSFLYYPDEDFYDYYYEEQVYDKSGNRYNVTNFYNKEKVLRSKRVYELLERNNPQEIKKLLTDFLAIADEHKVDYNLNADKWFDLVYHPENRFQVDSLIRLQANPYENFTPTIGEETVREKYVREHTTDYYIRTSDLKSAFENIDDLKTSNTFLESLHFFIWFSFVLAMLIFIFRISGIKQLIFSIVTGGVISMFIGLVTLLFNYIGLLNSGYNTEEYFILYLSLFIINIILFATIFFTEKLNKTLMSVLVNLSLASFTANLFLIIVLITEHQKDACRDKIIGQPCSNLLDLIGGEKLSFILFVLGIVFVYFYASIIKKWKGSPEG